jgi:hypothetical protein
VFKKIAASNEARPPLFSKPNGFELNINNGYVVNTCTVVSIQKMINSA